MPIPNLNFAESMADVRWILLNDDKSILFLDCLFGALDFEDGLAVILLLEDIFLPTGTGDLGFVMKARDIGAALL